MNTAQSKYFIQHPTELQVIEKGSMYREAAYDTDNLSNSVNGKQEALPRANALSADTFYEPELFESNQKCIYDNNSLRKSKERQYPNTESLQRKRFYEAHGEYDHMLHKVFKQGQNLHREAAKERSFNEAHNIYDQTPDKVYEQGEHEHAKTLREKRFNEAGGVHDQMPHKELKQIPYQITKNLRDIKSKATLCKEQNAIENKEKN
ncbi:hypothetical protein EVAR_101493_1 [Eumeta japonica]|uniref:Uncharacterized protein n=1 Tax=Eumeta variegata TaxID=151549 RepID=A0A4C1SYP0_EUMVA|nr:hypothetical protein EVAR_101493_1 [Eumeta japonica]